MNSSDDRPGLRDATTVGDCLAHPCQLIQARLDGIEHGIVGGDGAVVDRQDERFQLVTQISHGRDAGHARSALERVQRPLQRRTVLRARAVATPIRERVLRGIDELQRFLAEDGGDFGIEVTRILDRLLLDGSSRLGGCSHRAGRRSTRLRRSRCGSALRWRRVSRREALVQHRLGLADAPLQFKVSDKVAGGLIEMRRNGLHGLHAVCQHSQIRFGKTQPAADHPPQPMIQRLGETNPVPRLRHFRATRKSVARAINILRDAVRLWS